MPSIRRNRHLANQAFDDLFFNLFERLIVSISRIFIREYLHLHRDSRRVRFLDNRRLYGTEEEDENESDQDSEEPITESEENEDDNSNRAPDIFQAKSIRGLDEVDQIRPSFIQSFSNSKS